MANEPDEGRSKIQQNSPDSGAHPPETAPAATEGLPPEQSSPDSPGPEPDDSQRSFDLFSPEDPKLTPEAEATPDASSKEESIEETPGAVQPASPELPPDHEEVTAYDSPAATPASSTEGDYYDENEHWHHDEHDYGHDPAYSPYEEPMDAPGGTDPSGSGAVSAVAPSVPRRGAYGGGGRSGVPSSEPDEDEEGGPIKGFLEHLEDLRWTIVKSLVALVVGMVVCLVAANKLVSILTWPLDKANIKLQEAESKKATPGETRIQFQLGTNLWSMSIDTNQLPGIAIPPDRPLRYHVVPLPVGTNLVFVLQPDLTDEVAAPVRTKGNLIVLGPFEGFKVALQVGIYGGLALSSPFIFYFIGQFVVPALRRNEKKYLFRAAALGGLLFFGGVVFCYFAVVQIVLIAAVHFAHWLNFNADQWRATEYIGVVCKFMLGMGLGFELPVILLTLVKIGLLDYEKLSKFRMYWVVVNMVISSVLTPPDPISMMLMAIPLQILYEISVLIARMWHRRDQKLAAESSLSS